MSSDAALVVDELTAGYGGGDVLHEVSFSVPRGEITCVVGPNGAGKSTLMAAISGLLRPSRGRVLLDGAELTGASPRQVLDRGVVQVPQNHSLFREMTVRENIELGGYTLGRGLAVRRRAGVEEMFPAVAAWSGKKAGSLSGGQQRLVEFARCLMLDPSVIILDEPSMGLAPKVLRSVFDAVRAMNASGKTVLLVEQNARAGLTLASRGVVLENGRVRLTGTGREVLEHPEIGALYLGGSAGRGRRDPGGAVVPGRTVVPGHTVVPGGAVIVDAHCHVIPAEMMTAAVPRWWRPVIRRRGDEQVVEFQGRQLRSVVAEFSDVDVMLAQAAAAGVTHLLLSPWIMLVPVSAPVPEALRVCRAQNDALAAAAATRLAAIRVLGAVPLQDPAAAARELARLMGLPGVAGAEVPASVAGCYLGDPRFLPFWETAAGTGALIFVHPSTAGFGPATLADYYLWNSVGNPLETAISAAHLIAAGVLERFPELRVLLAHGGGALPALRGRLRRAFAVRPEARAACAAGPDASLRRLYFDSLTHDPAVLADLVACVGAEHVLLGSDRPFDMGTADPAGDLAAAGLPPGDEQLIRGGNAGRLLGIGDG